MTYLTNQYLALDTETTGLDPQHADIIELAAVPLDEHLNPREKIHPYQSLIRPRPDAPIVKKAIEVSGHTWVYDKNCEKYQEALPQEEAWQDFFGWIEQCYERPAWIILVGWNVSFDEAFLRQLHARTADNHALYKFPWPFHYHKIDLIAICRYLDLRAGRVRRTYKLEKMAENFFGKDDNVKMHTALDDTQMSIKVLRRMETLDQLDKQEKLDKTGPYRDPNGSSEITQQHHPPSKDG